MTHEDRSKSIDQEALAKFRKALWARMQELQQEIALGENAPARKIVRAAKRQLIAILVGLPRCCERRACRRHRTCAYRGAPCLEEQRKIARPRLAALSGSSGDPRLAAGSTNESRKAQTKRCVGPRD